METVSVEFGYCPLPLRISGHGFAIEPLDDLDSIVKKIGNCPVIKDGWLYCSPAPASKANYPPERVFSLPKTHVLTIQGSPDEEKLRFVVWCLSFLIGMRLTTTEAGFLDATPIEPRLLVDFFADEKSIVGGLERALRFYDLCGNGKNPKPNAKRYEAAIHALFLSQNPRNLDFEAFFYLYMTLDNCFSIMSKNQDGHVPLPHSKRLQWMCDRLKISTPEWAKSIDKKKKKNPNVSDIRNNTIHEAIFMGEPLGFSVLDPNSYSTEKPTSTLLEMRYLICRLLVSILDEEASCAPRISYVGSSIETRSTHSLDFS